MSEDKRSLCLYVAGAGGESKRFELKDGVTVIGRDSDTDIVITDPSISRRHAVVKVSSDKVTIKDGVDEPSANGVYVNNRRISGEKTLADKDVIKMGVFRFELRRLLADEAPLSITQVENMEELALYLKKSDGGSGDADDLVMVVKKMGLTEEMVRATFDTALDAAMSRNELTKVASLSKVKLLLLSDIWDEPKGAHKGFDKPAGEARIDEERDSSSNAVMIALIVAALVLLIVAFTNILS